MHANIGTVDRVVRFGIGLGLIVIGIYSRSGLAIVGGLFSWYEALSSWCVVYQLLGRNTCPLPPVKRQPLRLLSVFFQGIAVLGVAIGMNMLAKVVNWETWYGFLQQPTQLSLDNALFLFVLYPVSLGIAAKYAKLPEKQQ